MPESFFERLPELCDATVPKGACLRHERSGFDPYAFLNLESGSTLKDPQAQYEEARTLLRTKPDMALKYLESAALANHTEALDFLGMLYASGGLLEKNPQRAFSMFKKSAALGSVKAKFHLAMALKEGFGCRSNPQEAFAWLRVAAKAGLSEAILAMAECFDEGIGVEKNPIQAESFFIKAALQGEKRAVERMVSKFAYGPEPDAKECFRWVLKGAAAGVASCLLPAARYMLQKDPSYLSKGFEFLEAGALNENVGCLTELSLLTFEGGSHRKTDLISALVCGHLASAFGSWRAARLLEKIRAQSSEEELREAAEIAALPNISYVVGALRKRRLQATEES